MNNNNRKIFFSDLDATLLTDDKIITPKTMDAIKRFTDAGNLFTICTGRAIESAIRVKDELGLNFKGSYIVSYNGSQIYDCDNKKTVYRIGIDYDYVKKIFALAAKYKIHAHTYTDTHIISPDDGECLAFYRKVIKTPYIKTNDVLSELPVPPSKCLAIELHDHEKMERFHKELDEIITPDLSSMYSNPYYLEIINSKSGKGAGVTKLCEYLNIPIENSLAAGDEENDISMIKAAGVGIAMINGKPEVKNSANQITLTDNNHDGLVPFLTV